MADPADRKRRDDLDDQLGAPIYTDQPEPPFLFTGTEFVMACFRFDPEAFRPFLPPGLTLFRDATANLYIFRCSDAGVGIRSCDVAMLAVSVNEYPSPDTAEAGYLPQAFMSGPSGLLARQNYAVFLPGEVEILTSPGRIEGRVTCDGVPVARLVTRVAGEVRTDTSASDRYFGRNAAGELVTSIITGVGHSQAAEVEALEFGPAAPDSWRALAPTQLLWGLSIPLFFFSWSVPEPWLAEPPPDLAARRRALTSLFDGQHRACALVDAEGRLIHANAGAQQLLAEHALLRQGRLHPPQPEERARLAQALAAATTREAALTSLVLQSPGRRHLLAQVAPADPALAGPDVALLLIADPAAPPRGPRGDLLQLLGLTPAEARIAAAVGAGLPPREAALRLGLAESTVRSSLKVIFGKLGLTRQAELARLIARLEV